MSISNQPALESDDLLTLAAIKKDGSFDAIKVQLLAVLKEDPELVSIAEAAILDCEAFKEATAEGVIDEALQRELRKDADLENQLLKEVMRKLWHHATDANSELSQRIDRTIQQKLCAIHEQSAGKAN